VLAVVSLFTGFRIAFLPFRLCPFIFGAAAALIAWGAWGQPGPSASASVAPAGSSLLVAAACARMRA
jgi:hypothetical protein